MGEEGKNVANLKMEIDAEVLKKIVASGNLTEFVENASDLAAEQIRVQIFEELGKIALEASEKGRKLKAGIQVNVNFIARADEYGWKYGTRCVPVFCTTVCKTPYQERMAAEVAGRVIGGLTKYAKISME